jgi:hypothetical protein
MEIAAHAFWTLIHGLGFGALYLLECSGALVELYGLTTLSSRTESTPDQQRFLKVYLLTMVFLAWAAVLTGGLHHLPLVSRFTPPGTTELAMFPQRLLISSPTTIGWHSLGMEWKEHVAWFAPISITMVAVVFLKYGRDLKNHRQLRAAVPYFAVFSFVAAGIAGFFGAMLNKYAPVHGGHTIQLSPIRTTGIRARKLGIGLEFFVRESLVHRSKPSRIKSVRLIFRNSIIHPAHPTVPIQARCWLEWGCSTVLTQRRSPAVDTGLARGPAFGPSGLPSNCCAPHLGGGPLGSWPEQGRARDALIMGSYDAGWAPCASIVHNTMAKMTSEALDEQARIAFDDLVIAVKSGKCNLFLGAAVNAPPPAGDPRYHYDEDLRPPIGNGLANKLLKACEAFSPYPFDDPHNLLRVSQHYESVFGRDRLANFLRDEVQKGKEPSAALRAIATLNFSIIITTNYDKLFEDALALAGKRPYVSVYKPNRYEDGDDLPWNDPPRVDRPMLFKMHGDIEKPETIVLTDEDYINFIVRMREVQETSPVPQRIQTSLVQNPTLFIGYSLRDYNLRVLLKMLRAGKDSTRFPPIYAIDRSPDPLIWEFWYEKANPKIVNFVARDIWTFVPALYQQVTGAEMPA